MHEHSWYFTLAPARWTATCGCGLAVTVEEHDVGRQRWEWRLHGEVPPAALLLEGIGSVQQARRELLAGLTVGS